jgi:hypothetical protein
MCYDDFLDFLGRIQEPLSCDNRFSHQVRDENLLNNRKDLCPIQGAFKSLSKLQNRVYIIPKLKKRKKKNYWQLTEINHKKCNK